MTSVWAARGYWVLACVVLPLLNPYALALAVAATGVTWPVFAVVLAFLNLVVLFLVGYRTWGPSEDFHWRVALGLALAVALSIPFGFGELVLYLDLACPDEGCFN